jgi:ribulose 1,5-bisphosphate synthetase/thiazole synthase
MKRRDLFRMGALLGVSLSDVGASTTGVWHEPARDTPVAESADVIVCGAGPAGVSAAISAARTGARTRLIEVHGCLGGVWTAGLLSNIIDSNGKTGLMPEILSRLRETGTQIDAFRYDAECMKRLLETMCTEAGVKVLLHTRVVAAYKDSSNKLTTVVTENKSGRQAWHGKAFVDTTGDGDLAALAGCHFDLGHPVTGKMQPMTLMALLMGVAMRRSTIVA